MQLQFKKPLDAILFDGTNHNEIERFCKEHDIEWYRCLSDGTNIFTLSGKFTLYPDDYIIIMPFRNCNRPQYFTCDARKINDIFTELNAQNNATNNKTK